MQKSRHVWNTMGSAGVNSCTLAHAVLCCRETDENISEPQFINLSYVQAQHDYLAGNYPVVREDAAQVSCRPPERYLLPEGFG
jgi:hypothetical protein